MERILLAVDGSDHAQRAARVAGELSSGLGASVDVINVVPERRMMPGDAMVERGSLEHVYVNEREILRGAGRQVVDQAARIVRDAGGTVGDAAVLVGDAAHRIAEQAKASNVDCIVLGRRGLGDVGGLFMGSVSHKVGNLTDTTLVTTG
ncbi:MAG: universal stress protein [Acidimicrobiia bacterium]